MLSIEDYNLISNSDIDFLSIDSTIRKGMFRSRSLEDSTPYVNLQKFYETEYPKEMNIAHKINSNYYNKLTRVRKFIAQMLYNGNCLFLTFTFTDEVLQNTNATTRRKYINRFLCKYNKLALANIDYGSDNGREHYHCIIQTNKVNYLDWVYGNLDFEKVRQNNAKALGSYLNKFAFHSIKDTTQHTRVIYHRPKGFTESNLIMQDMTNIVPKWAYKLSKEDTSKLPILHQQELQQLKLLF